MSLNITKLQPTEWITNDRGHRMTNVRRLGCQIPSHVAAFSHLQLLHGIKMRGHFSVDLKFHLAHLLPLRFLTSLWVWAVLRHLPSLPTSSNQCGRWSRPGAWEVWSISYHAATWCRSMRLSEPTAIFQHTEVGQQQGYLQYKVSHILGTPNIHEFRYIILLPFTHLPCTVPLVASAPGCVFHLKTKATWQNWQSRLVK